MHSLSVSFAFECCLMLTACSGVHLTDLVYIDENPDTIPYKDKQLINFAKRKLVYGVISQLQRLQQTPYNIQPVHQIVVLLKKLPCLDEATLYRKSLEREPRKAKLQDIL
jgi:hypothetical protein